MLDYLSNEKGCRREKRPERERECGEKDKDLIPLDWLRRNQQVARN